MLLDDSPVTVRLDRSGGADGPRLAELASWSDDPSAILAVNDGTHSFRTPGIPGFLAYRRSGRWLVQVGGAIAPKEARPQLIAAFSRHAAARGLRVVAVQLQRRDALEHRQAGFTVNQLGSSYALPLERFTLRGKPFVSLRNKISRARRAGVEIEHTSVLELDPATRVALAALDAEWLRTKGRFVRPLEFLVGELGGRAAPLRRLALARVAGHVVGYVSLSPVYGSRPGWLHDLSRRSAAAPPGTMELLVSSCLDRCLAEEVGWWHFGFTPFSGLDPAAELPGASPLVTRLVRLLAEHGERIYPAGSQSAYKRKWGELERLPDYISFDRGPSPAAVLRVMRVTNLI
jgi:lysylphosphatidylglycerol synthetase-like protein (DUF2156 family)